MMENLQSVLAACLRETWAWVAPFVVILILALALYMVWA
jgi:hypothetical protein